MTLRSSDYFKRRELEPSLPAILLALVMLPFCLICALLLVLLASLQRVYNYIIQIIRKP